MSRIQIAWILALAALAKGDHPVSSLRELDTVEYASTSDVNKNNQEVYRLPENVIPLEYDIYIDLYFAERTDRPFSYDGRETIVIQALQNGVSKIVLHANVDRINAVSVLTSTGTPVAVNASEPFTLQPEYHFLVVNLDETLVIGDTYVLYIEYTNNMNVGPMKRGIWWGHYTDYDNIFTQRIYATTHFQPYNARQAFPCWDEPLYKATFKVHLSSPANYNAVFSNTAIESTETLPDGRIRNNFLVTPKMSSYLVTFLVSETFTVIAQDTSFTPPIRIIGRSNTIGLGDHSLDLAVKMTTFFDSYFEIPYASLHPNLLNDHISSPDWASAGTENWGMVSYRELYLTLNTSESIMTNQHYAGTLVSHELAHKWFGNLITCFWWSNTWINEGFASYFGYIATNQMFPEYEYEDHFNSRYLQNSLSFDSGSTVPLNHDVNTPAQVTGHFGTVSYSKGAAFLRMVHDMITPETFRKACRYFLTNNAFEATDQYDLYRAFAQAIGEDGTLNEYVGFDFQEFYRIWVNEAGSPILLVEINHETGVMALKQERFFLSTTATPTGQIYPIPITYSTKSNPTFESLKPIAMMSGETLGLNKNAGEEWVIFNNLQHGHYRVTYDDRSWNLIADALLNERETIHYLNRAQVVDDVFALMRSERMTYNFGFNILRFLRDEDNMHVWDAAISGFTWLRNRLRHLPESQAEFDAFVLDNMEHLIDHVGFDVVSTETPTDTMNRQAALHFACLLGHEKCVSESRQRFLALRDSNAWVAGGIRRNVYVVGVREGGQPDFEFMFARFRASNLAHDQLEMLRAMGATRDPELLTRYLELTLTDEVKSHDKATSFNYALLGNRENTPTVLEFVKNNIDAMRVAYVEDAPPSPVHTCLSNLAAYLEEPELVEYEEWLRSTQVGTLQYTSALSAITSSRNNMAWGTNNVDIILGATRGDATRIVTSAVVLTTTALLAMIA